MGLGMEGARMLCKAGGVRRRFRIQTPGGAYIAFFAMCAMRGSKHAALLKPDVAHMPQNGMYAPPTDAEPT